MKRREFINKSTKVIAGSLLFVPFTNATEEKRPGVPVMTPDPSSWDANDINIAWIGHSTVLINFFGTYILTDPILFERIGVNIFGLIIGPSRYSPPALDFDNIPKPDLVLLSHAHMDHTDYKSLSKLTSKFPNQIHCVTAFNTKDVTSDLKWKSQQEIDWRNELNILDLNIKALEVEHFGWRYPWEKDRSKGYYYDGRSYNAYLIEKNGKTILFGGDTNFNTKLQEAALPSVDIAIMPIGAYNPWRRVHCTPEEAIIMASKHLNAKIFVPIHCNTFMQGREPINEPIDWIKRIHNEYNIHLGLTIIGETFSYKASI